MTDKRCKTCIYWAGHKNAVHSVCTRQELSNFPPKSNEMKIGFTQGNGIVTLLTGEDFCCSLWTSK